MSERTKLDVRRDYSSTLSQFEELLAAETLRLNDIYQPRLRALALEYTMLVEQAAPVKIEKGTPPNENSKPVPPATKIEYPHPCGGDKCMNSPCCEDGMSHRKSC